MMDIKAIKDVVWAQEGLVENLNKQYLDDFCYYWFDLGGRETGLEDQIPLYMVLPNRNKLLCCSIGVMALYWAVMGVVSLAHRNGLGFIWLAIACALCIIVLIASYPPRYWYCKKKYRVVETIRFFTKEALDRYEQDHKALRVIVEPYLAKAAEEKTAKEATEKAEKEALRQAELAKEEEAKQKARAEFYPQFLVLLSYVETNFKVSTPNPNCHEGKFTIMLPRSNAIGTDEWNFDFNEEEVDRLVIMIASMDMEMCRRIGLREMIDANVGNMISLMASHNPSIESED